MSRIGHLYCEECIGDCTEAEPGAECPRCAAEFAATQGEGGHMPGHMLGDLYVPMLTPDDSDRVLEVAVASSWCGILSL